MRTGILKTILVSLCLLMALPAFVGAEGEPSAMDILKKADAAIKAVDAVYYKVKVVPTGIAARRNGAAEGEGYMFGWDGGGPEKFYASLKTTKADTGESVEVEGGGDGESYFVIDHTAKKAYEDMDPGVMGTSGRILRGLGMAEYVHNAPFDDELGAEKAELQGTETISGEKCYKIHVVYAGGQGQSTWYFAESDFLPRRRVRHISNPRGEGTIDTTISNLKVDPKAKPELFKLTLPEGYEQIDDFAP
jgi:outer membrane lipoprotein-sorting protein